MPTRTQPNRDLPNPSTPPGRVGETNDDRAAGQGNSRDDERGEPGHDRPGQRHPSTDDAAAPAPTKKRDARAQHDD